MNEQQLAASYAKRAAEYIDLFGSIDTLHPDDLALVRRGAKEVPGPVLDAGCGPGQWTAYLHSLGVEVSGIDLVPDFIAHAQEAYRGIQFTVGSMKMTGLPKASVSGILAWYSLIHLDPAELGAALAEFLRVLAPGGQILIGFFDDGIARQFDHKVATAHAWPVDEMAGLLAGAGFDEEQRVTRMDDGHRPHAAIIARAAAAPPLPVAEPSSPAGRTAFMSSPTPPLNSVV